MEECIRFGAASVVKNLRILPIVWAFGCCSIWLLLQFAVSFAWYSQIFPNFGHNLISDQVEYVLLLVVTGTSTGSAFEIYCLTIGLDYLCDPFMKNCWFYYSKLTVSPHQFTIPQLFTIWWVSLPFKGWYTGWIDRNIKHFYFIFVSWTSMVL